MLSTAMGEITIDHEVRAGELGEIAAQHGRIYRAEYGLDHRFEAYVAKGVGEAALAVGELAPRFWIVRKDDRFVGSAAVCRPEGGVGQFRWFLLDPEVRGRGLGDRIMHEAIAWARDVGCTRMLLWTYEGLDAAAKLYRRHGFVETERVPGSPWGPPVVQQRYDLALRVDG